MSPEINRRLGQVRKAMGAVWEGSQSSIYLGGRIKEEPAKAKETKGLYHCGNRLCTSTNITIEDAPTGWSPGWIVVRCHDHNPNILTPYPKIKTV